VTRLLVAGRAKAARDESDLAAGKAVPRRRQVPTWVAPTDTHRVTTPRIYTVVGHTGFWRVT